MSSDGVVRSYSASYFSFRTRIEKELLGAIGDSTELKRIIARDIADARNKGDISSQEEDDLLYFMSRGVVPAHSEEYIRISKIYKQLSAANISIDEMTRQELNEEIDLAFREGYLSDDEAFLLEEMLKTIPEESSVIIYEEPIIMVPPQRRKKAKNSTQHSEEYMSLLKDYKQLYSMGAGDKPGKVKAFFAKLGEAYRNGQVSVKEFKEFHDALDSHEAFMNAIEIDVSSSNFAEFREELIKLVSDDLMVKQCIRQIVSFGRHRGISEFRANHSPITVARQQLIPFFRANEDITTFLSEAYGGKGELLIMRLDLSASTN